MAFETITIDLDAYERLARLKSEGQSFSRVIEELVPARVRARDVLEALDRSKVSESTLDAVERVVAERRGSPVRVRRW